MARTQRRTALLYDAPLSTPQDLALVKAMLLFFDDIAVFPPPALSLRGPRPELHLAAPLVDRGLLQFVVPQPATRSQTEVIVRTTLLRAATENAEHWLAAVTTGSWDLEIPRLQGRFFGPSPENMGEASTSSHPGSLALFKLLAQEGVLFPDDATDDDSILVPGVPSVVNSILAQAVRTAASEQGWLIEPVATRRDEAKVFTAILDDAVENVGAADVATSDMSAVTFDLSRVGLDDLLDFRARHRSEFRAHLLALRALVAPGPSAGDLADRRAVLVDEAHRLRELQRRRWPNLGPGVTLGIVGAAWALAGGDLLGALIGAAGSQLLPVDPTPVSAYTYILHPEAEPDGHQYLEGRTPELGP